MFTERRLFIKYLPYTTTTTLQLVNQSLDSVFWDNKSADTKKEWSYQHPDKMSTLSKIPLADEMSHKLRISLTFNSMSHDHIQCGCVHSSMHLLQIMIFFLSYMHSGRSFILKRVLLVSDVSVSSLLQTNLMIVTRPSWSLEL